MQNFFDIFKSPVRKLVQIHLPIGPAVNKKKKNLLKAFIAPLSILDLTGFPPRVKECVSLSKEVRRVILSSSSAPPSPPPHPLLWTSSSVHTFCLPQISLVNFNFISGGNTYFGKQHDKVERNRDFGVSQTNV